ncbi:hypothetical protein [Streptomyces sp. NBC_00391]|uniref:hypothetical protein n=1 Tax=Streptomyces sp. NBC_00391 TaxID=2903647 RepID=UPI002E23FFE4
MPSAGNVTTENGVQRVRQASARRRRDRFLIGVAVLTIVGEPAKERPMLIIADDPQWLDEPSAQRLAFVARRLRNEPVVTLLTGLASEGAGPWHTHDAYGDGFASTVPVD